MIVHSELYEAVVGVQSDTDLSLGFSVSQGPPNGEEAPPQSPTTHPVPPPSAPETHPLSPPISSHSQEVLSTHNGPLESGELVRMTTGETKLVGVGLTNGFHSPENLRHGRETLDNGDHRLCPKKKVLSQPGLPPSPAAFATSGLVQSTSGAQSYLCS